MWREKAADSLIKIKCENLMKIAAIMLLSYACKNVDPAVAVVGETSKQPIQLIYSGNMRGDIEPCG